MLALNPAARVPTLKTDDVDGVSDTAAIIAVVAVDYLHLRFKDVSWQPPIPRLQALRDTLTTRPAFASTEPFI